MAFLTQYKTYLASAGLVGLALYQASQGDLQSALTTFLGAFAAAAIRHETAPTRTAAPPVASNVPEPVRGYSKPGSYESYNK